MRNAQEIFDCLDALAAPGLAMDWDNSGLQIGSRKKPVQTILVALDPFEDVCREAIAIGADLVVTHHPLFFPSANAITDETGVGRAAALLIQNGIALYSCHTNLDIAKGGVNDVLAQRLGLREVQVVGAEQLLRLGRIPEQTLDEFLKTVRENLDCPGLRYVDGGKRCSRVAVGGGACGDELLEAARGGCDTFVTSDVKYNTFWDAWDMGINLIDAGHFYTENPVCTVLAGTLERAFPELSVRISEKHADCMKFFGLPR